DWTTRFATVGGRLGRDAGFIQLRRDDEGRWWSRRSRNPGEARSAEEPIAGMDEVHDIDFAISPVTNTLPIRRLALAVGEARDTDALWVGFPDLVLERLPQRYTREADRTYTYESNGGEFRATLEVDEHGVVVRYGELWERVASGD